MPQNFSEDARRALENAQSAAAELGQRYIGSEHLLLGLLLGEDSVGGSILHEAGAAFDAAKEKLTQLCETGDPIHPDTMEITRRLPMRPPRPALKRARSICFWRWSAIRILWA